MSCTKGDLKNCECPMNWDLKELQQCVKIDRLIEKLKERLEDETVGPNWKSMIILMFLSYEHYNSQSTSFNFNYLRHIDEIIQRDTWISKYHTAAQHIVYAMWAHIYLRIGNQKSALKYISMVKPVEEMTDADKAFLYGMKACYVMMYGPPGNVEAAKIFDKVLELEKNEPEWYYLKGKCLARMRRLHYRSKPQLAEVTAFTQAVEMDGDCARYLVHLARSKADIGNWLKFNRTSMNDDKAVHALNVDVESLLRKAVRFSLDSSHLICHIARSLMKLPEFYRQRNRELLEFCVERAREISPLDPFVNHTAGLFYLRLGQVDSAVRLLTEASNMGVHAASFDLCRLKWLECRGYDPVPDLTDLINESDHFAASEAHGLLATYYFFVKNDLLSTVRHWKQWHPSRGAVSHTTTSCFLGNESFDFNSVLYDEIRLELKSTRFSNHEDRLQLEEVLKIVNENRPELQMTPPTRQRQALIDKAQMLSRLGRALPTKPKWLVRLNKSRRAANRKDGETKDFKNKNDSKKNAAPGDLKRSQSSDTVYENQRKKHSKPFWRPPARYRSVDNLPREKMEKVGSGKLCPGSIRFSKNKGKAVSTEDLLLSRSYEAKKTSFFKFEKSRNSSGKWRSGSQESLVSNSLRGDAKRTSGANGLSRAQSSEYVSGSGSAFNRRPSTDEGSGRLASRTSSSEQVSMVIRSAQSPVNRSRRDSDQESVCATQTPISGSAAQSLKSWRRGEDSRSIRDDGSLKSAYFRSFGSNQNDSSRPNSRSSTRQGESPTSTFFQSRGFRSQNESSRPQSRTSTRQGESPTSTFFQSWGDRNRNDQAGFGASMSPSGHGFSQGRPVGRGGYIPRGGSISRGGSSRGGAMGDQLGRRSLEESRDDFFSAFNRLNIRRN